MATISTNFDLLDMKYKLMGCDNPFFPWVYIFQSNNASACRFELMSIYALRQSLYMYMHVSVNVLVSAGGDQHS